MYIYLKNFNFVFSALLFYFIKTLPVIKIRNKLFAIISHFKLVQIAKLVLNPELNSSPLKGGLINIVQIRILLFLNS